MTNLKLSTGEILRSGKHGGSSIQSFRQGISVKNKNNPRTTRSALQNQYRSFLMQCVRQWRVLSSSSRTLWNSWAYSYPQPTLLNPDRYLTGYQLFLKRNYYLYLYSPDTFSYLTDPIIPPFELDDLTCEVFRTLDSLILRLSFLRNEGHFNVQLFISPHLSLGKNFISTQWRSIASVNSNSQEIDITSEYISRFGHLPALHDNVFFSSVSAGIDQGQFTFHSKKVQEVLPYPVNRIGFYYNVRTLSRIAPPGWHIPEYYDVFDHFASLPNLEEICLSGSEFWNLEGWGFDPDHLQCVGNGFKIANNPFFYGIGEADSFALTFLSYTFPVLIVEGDNPASYLFNDNAGYPLRFVKDDNVPAASMTGNNGLIYPTTEYLGLIWTTIDSRETLFNDGSPIPEVTDLNLWPSTSVQSFCRRP